MRLRIAEAAIYQTKLTTRLPFRYGIATMTEAPHVFVRVLVRMNGRRWAGIAADHLPPKWFTKVPERSLQEEIGEMLRVVEQAVSFAAGMEGENFFEFWRALQARQEAWGREERLPELLVNFGTSLVERACLEAVAKAANRPFYELLAGGVLGVDPGLVESELAGERVKDLLAGGPRGRVIVRHTVGLADPLTDGEIAEGDRVNDSLPQSLSACIRRYGLKHFKLKISGKREWDLARLEAVGRVLDAGCESGYRFSLDGNEQFQELEEFRLFWEELVGRIGRETLSSRLLFVEQPFHREVALKEERVGELRNWKDRPQIIIDESGAGVGSLRAALELGYAGTSHKNCKGVMQGVVHACLTAKRRRDQPSGGWVMSGEDLANIGPVALLQDLAVASALGIESVERNGHHYFAGLSQFSKAVQGQVLEAHGDLYERSEQGWPTLKIRDGAVELGSVNKAPLGVGFELDLEGV